MLLFVSLFLLLADFLLTLSVKYYLNGLTFADIDLLQPGNLIHLILITALGALFTISYSGTKKKKSPVLSGFPIALLIGLVFLMAGYFVLISDSSSLMRIVYWDYRLFYILSGIFFACHYLILLGYISIFWLGILKVSNILVIRTVFNVLIITSILFFISFSYCFSAGNSVDEDKKFETGLILGSAVMKDNTPGNALKRRLDTGLELYKRNTINRFFLTGGSSPGRLSEAESGQAYLIRNFVPKDKIEFENKTTSTLEQLRFIKNFYKGKNQTSQLLIISDVFHLPRVNQMAGFFNLGLSLKGADSHTGFTQKFYTASRESIALIIFWLFAI